MGKNRHKQIKNSAEPVITNGLGDIATAAPILQTQTNTISQTDSLQSSLRGYMITQNRNLLAQLYVEIGLIQTLIKQPIDDAYKDDIIIVTEQFDDNEKKQVLKYFNENILDEYLKARKWCRLFGGAGLIINSGIDSAEMGSKEAAEYLATPFDINKIKKDTQIEFLSADRWELNYKSSGEINAGAYTRGLALGDFPYDYYGQKIHKSRVLRIVGEDAPSFLNQQLMGWGMSIVEKIVAPMNTYLKNRNVMYEVIDECKVDVYSIEGLNSALASPQGTEKVRQRVQYANLIKSYLNSLIMDTNDRYNQKQLSFTGLADVNNEGRIDLCCNFRMSLTKLFGLTAAGFNDDEGSRDNYNDMVESEIRSKDKKNLMTLLEIACVKCFGIIPDDLAIEFKPLKVLDAEQEENVKNSQFNRVIQAREAGILDDEQAIIAINTRNLLPITIGDKKNGTTRLSNANTTRKTI